MSREFKTRIFRGKIASVNYRTASGVVVVGKGRHNFRVTVFRSDAAGRYPRPGESVKAVFSGDGMRLLGVWAGRRQARAR